MQIPQGERRRPSSSEPPAPAPLAVPERLAVFEKDGHFDVSMVDGLKKRLCFAAFEAFASIPNGGVETGGLLLGLDTAEGMLIVDFLSVPISYSEGPFYKPGPDDEELLAKTAQGRFHHPSHGLLRVIGLYCIHTRRDAALTDQEESLRERILGSNSSIFLLLKPVAVSCSEAVLSLRRQGIPKLARKSCFVSFQMPRRRVEQSSQPTLHGSDNSAGVPMIVPKKEKEPYGSKEQDAMDAVPTLPGSPEPLPEVHSKSLSKRQLIPIPNFALPAVSSRSPGMQSLLLAVISVFTVLAVGFFLVNNFALRALGGSEPVTAPTPDPVLRVSANGSDACLRWDHFGTPEQQTLQSATLEIRDGNISRLIDLTASFAPQGVLVYTPKGTMTEYVLSIEYNGAPRLEKHAFFTKPHPAQVAAFPSPEDPSHASDPDTAEDQAVGGQ